MNYMSHASGVSLALAAALALCAMPGSTAAQCISTTLDVSRVSLHHDSVSSVAMAFTPMIRVDGSRSTFGLAGTFSRFEKAGWTNQGAAHAAIFAPIHGVFIGEFAAKAGASVHDGGAGSAQGLAQARLHVMGARLGGWAGGGSGRGWDGRQLRKWRIAESGIWFRSGPSVALATFAPTVVDDSIRFADAELALRMDFRSLELAGSATVRSGDLVSGSDADPRTWGSMSAAAWFAPWGAVIARAGVLPLDFAEGYSGGRYASVGLRLGSRPTSTAGGHRRRIALENELIEAARRQGLRSTAIEPQSSGRQRLTVIAPDARTVELMGDFTSWRTVALARGPDGSWTIALPTASGTHHVNIRVNGGAWVVPPGLPVVVDEFGVATGLLLVP